MKKRIIWVAFSLCLIIGLTNCKGKDPQPIIDEKGTIALEVKNVAGTQPLVLNTDTFTNALGEKFTVSMYKYYLSNFVFYKNDGSSFKQPESYYLMSAQDPASLHFTIPDVPVGDYDSVSFMIGVDEARNTQGSQTGALDPINGMYWAWLGYIMAKMEGYSPNVVGSGRVVLHIGGFDQHYGTQRMVYKKLPSVATVSTTKTPVISMTSDVLEWFTTPNPVSFVTTNNVMDAGETAMEIADNYAGMMTITEVK